MILVMSSLRMVVPLQLKPLLIMKMVVVAFLSVLPFPNGRLLELLELLGLLELLELVEFLFLFLLLLLWLLRLPLLLFRSFSVSCIFWSNFKMLAWTLSLVALWACYSEGVFSSGCCSSIACRTSFFITFTSTSTCVAIIFACWKSILLIVLPLVVRKLPYACSKWSFRFTHILSALNITFHNLILCSSSPVFLIICNTNLINCISK